MSSAPTLLTLKRVSFAQFQAFPSRPQRIELTGVEERRRAEAVGWVKRGGGEATAIGY
ncbi:MAG: hypothetical protein ACLQVD_08495 [Capsulimonadaceae bacterium]